MRISSIIEFSVQDLLAKGARRTTWSVFLTVLVICAFTLAAYGLALGNRNVRMHRLKKQPLALCLWVGDSRRTGRINDGVLEQVREIAERSEAVDGVFPFRVISMDIQRLDNGNQMRLLGRTIADVDGKMDLLLSKCEVKAGNRELKASDEGIVCSPSMLMDKLGWDPSTPLPKTINIVIDSQPREVPVHCVLSQDLPYDLNFVIPQNYESTLTASAPPVSRIHTGLVPDNWPDFLNPEKNLLDPQKNLLDLLSDIGLRDHLLVRTDSGRLIVDTLSEVRPISQWRSQMRALHNALADMGYENDPSFYKDLRQGDDETKAIDAVKQETVAEPYDMMGIYFSGVERMKETATKIGAIDGLKDAVSKEIVDQLDVIGSETTAALKILSLFEFVIVLMAVWNLFVIQVLRAEQKIEEAGMLKAMGLGRQSLLLIVLTEAMLVWVAAVAISIPGGIFAGVRFARKWYSDPQEGGLGFVCPWWLVTSVILISLAVTLISAVIATSDWHKKNPAALLRRD